VVKYTRQGFWNPHICSTYSSCLEDWNTKRFFFFCYIAISLRVLASSTFVFLDRCTCDFPITKRPKCFHYFPLRRRENITMYWTHNGFYFLDLVGQIWLKLIAFFRSSW
jgi:hypothetical protein